MLTRTSLRVVALALVLILSNTELLAQKRISFQRGRSSATLRGNIGSKGYLEYVIEGRAGQVMSIEIKSGTGSVTVNAGTATGKSFSIEMTGGDHLLSIVNTARAATIYTPHSLNQITAHVLPHGLWNYCHSRTSDVYGTII